MGCYKSVTLGGGVTLAGIPFVFKLCCVTKCSA